MKINPVNQNEAVSRVMNVNSNSQSGAKISVDINDTVELSEGARKYSELVKNARKAMEVSEAEEEAKVSGITSRISGNTYEVSDEDVVNDILGGIPTHI